MQDLPINSRVPYLQGPGVYDDNSGMLPMPGQQQLDRMYPRMYYIINPAVVRQCDMLEKTKGPMYTPSKEELDLMTDNVQSEVEGQVQSEMTTAVSPISYDQGSDRRRDPDGSPFLRGLIGTLLIGELLGRRGYRPYRRYNYFPGYYPGYYPILYPGYLPGIYPGYYY